MSGHGEGNEHYVERIKDTARETSLRLEATQHALTEALMQYPEAGEIVEKIKAVTENPTLNPGLESRGMFKTTLLVRVAASTGKLDSGSEDSKFVSKFVDALDHALPDAE